MEILEPNITKFQTFTWKVKASEKIYHLMWQMITGHVAVTRNLKQRNMRCDNYYPRCGEPEKTVAYSIFKCLPALQVWSLSATPSSPNIFPLQSIYADIDYLLWRKNSIVEPKLDRDPYPLLIWYVWKARNDKLFREIDMDPLELVRYAKSEYQAWFNANEIMFPAPQEHCGVKLQIISQENICMVDGS